MQVKKTNSSETTVTLTITATADDLTPLKERTVKRLGKNVRVPGFREGKAPLVVIEKHLSPEVLEAEFLDEAAGQLYVQALEQERLRPVDQPKVTLQKFVPFDQLEFAAEVEVVGDIELADYKKIKKTKKQVKVSAKDIDEVIDSLKKRAAEKKDVDRASKEGDQVWIDFSGKDDKGEPVKGADGKDYPLLLGSNTFIPGFEPNLVGLKAGEEKTFTIPFPKDYGIKALRGKKVTFEAKVTKVQEVIEPKLDDEFAAKVGPFKSVDELKEDIKNQLLHERQHEADRELENEIIKEIIAKSKVALPQALIDEQVERLLQEARQNLMYRGQTFEEMLEAEGFTDESYRKEVLIPRAEERVKGGILLGEIAEQEKINVTPEELEIRMQLLKGQYTDAAMQAELDKPESRRDIVSRMVTEKTVAKLVGYATES